MLEVAIVYGSFLVAVITAAACAKQKGLASTSTVGPPAWHLTESWGTNVAVFGVLFGTFFSTKIVPDPKLVLDPGYPLLSVLFALLALVAPIVFVAMSNVKQVKKAGAPEIQAQGTATGFYIAMVFTLWAALGQLATLGDPDRGLVEDPVHPRGTVTVGRDLGHEQQIAGGHDEVRR